MLTYLAAIAVLVALLAAWLTIQRLAVVDKAKDALDGRLGCCSRTGELCNCTASNPGCPNVTCPPQDQAETRRRHATL